LSFDSLKTVLSQWGVIGPQRLFSQGQLYYGLTFCFLVGAIAPLIQWISHKKLGLDVLKYVNFPVMFGDAIFLPPATPLNYVPMVLLCFVFNNFIRRRHFGWWSKYICEYLLLRFVKTTMFFLFLT
jgi:hypothetical protein